MSFVVLNCQVVEWVDIFANLVFKNPGINKLLVKGQNKNKNKIVSLKKFHRLRVFTNISLRKSDFIIFLGHSSKYGIKLKIKEAPYTFCSHKNYWSLLFTLWINWQLSRRYGRKEVGFLLRGIILPGILTCLCT